MMLPEDKANLKKQGVSKQNLTYVQLCARVENFEDAREEIKQEKVHDENTVGKRGQGKQGGSPSKRPKNNVVDSNDDMKCPFPGHENHTWKNCFGNPNGPNYKVYKKLHLSHSDKLREAFSGPYSILRVHTNGTVTIQLTPTSTERINIRRLKPVR